MVLKEIENYDNPKIPNKVEFLSANNIVSVISIGLLTFTLCCSPNIQIIEKDTNSSDSLLTNYPNPFMPTTTIDYKVENSSGQPDSINVSIFNIDGKLVRVLVNEFQESGEYKLDWNGNDENDGSVESGVYFYKLEINGVQSATKKMLLMK